MRILDGGLATELEAQGLDLSDHLWSARVLLTRPDAIEAAHLAYFRAGAEVATTASYQATVPGFVAAGLGRDDALEAIRRGVHLAQHARDRFAQERGRDTATLLVAGSVGPYGAMLADGSEYRGDYDPGRDALRDLHAPRMDALLDAGVDLLAMETIPTLREGEALVELLIERGARGWLSYQCRDARSTAAGEPIGDAVSIATGVDAVIAVGINCTAPRYVPALLAAARAATSKPLIAYPNGGDRWDPTERRWTATDPAGTYEPSVMARLAETGSHVRAEAGAEDARVEWLGGCCGVGPTGIAALATALCASDR
jgi:homocysteine S-methyltransferase